MQALLGLAQAGHGPYTFGLVQWKEFGGVVMYGGRSLFHQLGALLRAARGSGLWWVCREYLVGTKANWEQRRDQSPCPHPGGGRGRSCSDIGDSSLLISLTPASVVCAWVKQRDSQKPATRIRGEEERKKGNELRPRVPALAQEWPVTGNQVTDTALRVLSCLPIWV